MLVQHHLLLFSKLHSLIIVSVFMLLAIFFFLIIKGLKIIAVTKFSLKEAKSFSTWLLQRQGAFAQNRQRWQIELGTSQGRAYLSDVKATASGIDFRTRRRGGVWFRSYG